jgi:hypothetical protein
MSHADIALVLQLSSGFKKMIRGLLARDPGKRLGSKHGAAELKKCEFLQDVSLWCVCVDVFGTYTCGSDGHACCLYVIFWCTLSRLRHIIFLSLIS